MSQLAHRLAPVAGMVSVTALLVVTTHQMLKPAPQIRSCGQVVGGYGSQTQLRCIHEPGDTYKVASPSLPPRGSIEASLAPEASAAERLQP